MEIHFSGYSKIVANPAICNGQPRIEGTRITVAALLSYLAGGMQFEEILSGYPKLTASDIYQALSFAANNLQDRYLPLATSAAA